MGAGLSPPPGPLTLATGFRDPERFCFVGLRETGPNPRRDHCPTEERCKKSCQDFAALLCWTLLRPLERRRFSDRSQRLRRFVLGM